MTDSGGAGKPRYLGLFNRESFWSTEENITFNKRDDEALALSITGLRALEADWTNNNRNRHCQREPPISNVGPIMGTSIRSSTVNHNNNIASRDNNNVQLGIPGLRAIFVDLAAERQHDYHQSQWVAPPVPSPLSSHHRTLQPLKTLPYYYQQQTMERLHNGTVVVVPKPRYPRPPPPIAPPIVPCAGKENVRPLQLVRLSTISSKGQQHNLPQQLRYIHDPVWNPSQDPVWTGKLDPSPSKVIKPPPGFYLLPHPYYDNNTNVEVEEEEEDDDEEEEDEEEWIPYKTSATNAGSILRVVSYDEEDLYTSSTGSIHPDEQPSLELAKNDPLKGESGINNEGGNKKQVSPEEDEELVLVAPRALPAPRRLNYANAVISNLKPIVIYDIVPTLSQLPTTCNDYATLIGNILAEARPGDTGLAVAAAQVECVLRHMSTEYKEGRSKVRPDGGMYNKVMHGYAIQGNAEKVEELLHTMYEEYRLGDDLAEPNVKHYTTLLHAWQKANVADAPDHCEKILKEMHELHDSGSLSNCKPDTYTYTSVLHCWADSSREDAATRAEAIFREMKHRFESGDEGLRPDNIAYSNLINAIAKSKGYSRAEEILWEMVDDFLKGNPRCKPRIRNLNTILAVWSKSTAPYAPERAEYMVRRWLRITKTTELGDVKPDNFSYCLVLKSWAISPRRDVPDRTMQAMQWMKELYQDGEVAARIDEVKIGTCMTAWINTRSFRHAAEFLENTCNECLAGEHNIVPEYYFFNKTIRGLCAVDNVQRAEELVCLLWKLKSTKVRFGCDTLALVRFVIHEWIRLECPNRAEDLLFQMEALYRGGKIKEYPDGHTYQLVITAWNKSQFHDKKEHVRELKEKLKKNTDNATKQPFKFFRKA